METEREPEQLLLDAARAASRRGDLNEARRLHLKLLELYPRTAEANEAVVFLLKTDSRKPAAHDATVAGDETRRDAG